MSESYEACHGLKLMTHVPPRELLVLSSLLPRLVPQAWSAHVRIHTGVLWGAVQMVALEAAFLPDLALWHHLLQR